MSVDLVKAQSILLLTCPASPFIFHKLQTTSQSVTRLILHPLSIVPTCEKLLSQRKIAVWAVHVFTDCGARYSRFLICLVFWQEK